MSSALPGLPDVDDALAQRIVAELGTVEERLRESVAVDDAMVSWTARHLMDAGGKRVRPMLTLLAGALGNEPSERTIDAAVLVELTHLASLYHDDVMDSAPTRRGARSAHEVWSNSVAILTGDFLFARASALSSSLGPRAVLLHSATFEQLCLGQLRETVGVRDGDDPFAHYLDVLDGKTASLIALAGELGALCGGAADQIADIMRDYGHKVGIAFQLADDVLDLRSDADTSGKTPGTDLREGVPTMPTLLLRRRAADGDAAAQSIVERIDGDLSDDAELAAVVAQLRADPSLEEAHELAQKYGREAIDLLAQLPPGPVRDALDVFTRTLIDRAA